jgi:hypothetical protein
MPDQGQDFGDWRKSKPLGSSGSMNRLGNWKEDGEVTIWIHTDSKIFKRLLHVIKYVGTREDEKTGQEEEAINFLFFNCHEEVDEFFRRNKQGSEFPCHCPMCRFIEWLEYESDIEDGETVWEASIGDRRRDVIATKADFIGDTKAGGDFRLSFKPKVQEVLAVVDHDDIENGLVVASESFSLIEDTKKAIKNAIDSKGEELGDPAINPYAIKWKFNAKARKPSDYYDAYVYEQAKLTDEIRDLLDSDPLDLYSQIVPGDPEKLREIMEEHITIMIDEDTFDSFFDNVQEVHAGNYFSNNSDDKEDKEEEEKKEPPKKNSKSKKSIKSRKAKKEPEPKQEEDEEEEQPRKRRTRKPKDSKKKKTRSVRKTKPEPEPEPEEDDEDIFECENCGADVPGDASECPKCGSPFE